MFLQKKKSNYVFIIVLQAQSELRLQGLLPATSYLLSVQTVAYWGQKRLKSHRAQLVFTTISHTGKKKHLSHKAGLMTRLMTNEWLMEVVENLGD